VRAATPARQVIDLQLFAGDEPENTGGQSTPTDGGEPERQTTFQQTVQDIQNRPPEEPGASEPKPEPEPEVLDFGGRKVKLVDPALKDLHNDWSRRERTLQQEREARERLEQETAQLRTFAAQVLSGQLPQQPAQPTEPAPAGMSPEERAKINEQLLNQFWEDPMALVEQAEQRGFERAKAYIDQQLEPIQQQNAWNTMVSNLQSEFGEAFEEVAPELMRLTEEHPERLQRPEDLRTVFLELRAEQLAQRAQGPAFDPNDPEFAQQLLTDPAFESVRNQLITNYLQQKQTTQGQLPPSPSSTGGGGTAPAVPPNKPRTVKEAEALMRQYRGQVSG